MTFCKGSGAILFGISAFWPGGRTFLSEKHLKKFANAYSISENDLKHETLLAKTLLRKESQLPSSLEQFISFISPYKGAFDCLYKLLLIAVTLPVTSASCERIFSKMKWVKTFLRNSMASERFEQQRSIFNWKGTSWKIDLDGFVDEFHSWRDRIKLSWVIIDMKFWRRRCRDLCENRVANCLFV